MWFTDWLNSEERPTEADEREEIEEGFSAYEDDGMVYDACDGCELCAPELFNVEYYEW